MASGIEAQAVREVDWRCPRMAVPRHQKGFGRITHKPEPISGSRNLVRNADREPSLVAPPVESNVAAEDIVYAVGRKDW